MISDRSVARILLLVIGTYLIVSGISFVLFPAKPLTSYGLILAMLLFLFIDGIKGLFESLVPSKFHSGKEKLTEVTVIIPAANASETISKTLSSLIKRFPKDHIIVSANGCTDDTVKIVKSAGVKCINTKERIGKVNAINIALKHVKTPYTLIIDDDVDINGAQIPTSLLKKEYDGVAFRVIPTKNNILTEFQVHEYRKSMDVSRKYHNSTATVQNISGAIGLYKTSELRRQINIHSGEFSGEDLQRTLLVHMADESKGVVLCDSIVETEAPASLNDLFYQRVIGWYPAVYGTFRFYMHLLFRRKSHTKMRLEALYNTILLPIIDPFRLITLPFFLFVPINFVIFYIAYILLELIPYIKMGRKEPLWVILLYPLYGIFNLICRVIALGVFFYRRIVVYISGDKFLDSYRVASTYAKNTGLVLALMGTISVYSTYAYINSIFTPYVETYEESTLKAYAAFTGNDYPMIDLSYNEPEADKPISKSYEVLAQKGYGMWHVSEEALNEYSYEKNTRFSGLQRKQIIAEIMNGTEDYRIFEGETYQINRSLVTKSVEKYTSS